MRSKREGGISTREAGETRKTGKYASRFSPFLLVSFRLSQWYFSPGTYLSQKHGLFVMSKSGRLILLTLLHALPLAGCCDSDSSVGQPVQPDVTVMTPERGVCGSIEFIRGYSNGYERAQQENKPMLVFFTAEWCSFCHQMEAEAFTDSQVVRLATQFVCILVDADRESKVCEEFRVRGYPTIQFLSSRGVSLNRLTGKRPAIQLVSQMQAALTATATRDNRTTTR